MKILTTAAMKIAERAAVEQGGSYLELMEQNAENLRKGLDE